MTCPPWRNVTVCLAAYMAISWAQPDTWTQYYESALKASEQGRLIEAEKLFIASINEADKLASNDERLLASLLRLGILYHTQQKYAEAEPFLVRSLKIAEKILKPGQIPPKEPAWRFQGLYHSHEAHSRICVLRPRTIQRGRDVVSDRNHRH